MPSPRRTSQKLMHRARELRREPTAAESRLWACLRGSGLDGIKFRRQHAIGRYAVDSCASAPKLIIELDGTQHLAQEEADSERTAFLEAQGYTVLRFWNDKVLHDIDSVVRVIQSALSET